MRDPSPLPNATWPEPAIPTFSLYGEVDRDAELRFLHVESLEATNRLHRWNIRPHRHHDLHQLLFVRIGSGEALIDGEAHAIAAPALITVPALVVHGFRFHPASEGLILTIADAFRRDLVGSAGDEAIGDALRRPLVAGLPEAEFAGLDAIFRTVAAEFVDSRVGRATVIAANLLVAFVALARLHADTARLDSSDRRGEALFECFRAAVERRFREHWSIGDYARELATTRRTLHRLCRRFSGAAPQCFIHRRLALEAKRSLLYTAMSVAEVAYALGFSDPSYFSRFFTEQAGISPLAFRRAQAVRGKQQG